jgi:hypothetical protein
MDTSVPAGDFGRVNNIGLMRDQQNYLTLAGVGLIASLLMIIFGRRGADPTPSIQGLSRDPFDEIDGESENERKRYAISLGVTRKSNIYFFCDVGYSDMEAAIMAAENDAEEIHHENSHTLFLMQSGLLPHDL